MTSRKECGRVFGGVIHCEVILLQLEREKEHREKKTKAKRREHRPLCGVNLGVWAEKEVRGRRHLITTE